MNPANASKMKNTNSKSGLARRPKRKTSMLAATMSPAISPRRSEWSRVPSQATSIAVPTAARATQKRADHSDRPTSWNAAAISQ